MVRDGVSELVVAEGWVRRDGRTVVQAEEAELGGSLMSLLGCCGRRSGAVLDMQLARGEAAYTMADG